MESVRVGLYQSAVVSFRTFLQHKTGAKRRGLVRQAQRARVSGLAGGSGEGGGLVERAAVAVGGEDVFGGDAGDDAGGEVAGVAEVTGVEI
jgi:hypothetical protein